MNAASSPFWQQFNGNFKGMLRWSQLDDLWRQLRAQPHGWFVTQLGQERPEAPLDEAGLLRFIDEADALLRREHQHDYCGIVFADAPAQPQFIKIFDPHNLGSSCSHSNTPILPLWVLSRTPPERLDTPTPQPSSRSNWWTRLFDQRA